MNVATLARAWIDRNDSVSTYDKNNSKTANRHEWTLIFGLVSRRVPIAKFGLNAHWLNAHWLNAHWLNEGWSVATRRIDECQYQPRVETRGYPWSVALRQNNFVMQPTSELPNYVQAKIGRNKWLDANFKHGLKPLAIHEQSLCGKKRLQFPQLNATAPSELQKSNHVGRHDLTGRIIVDGVPNQRNSLSATKERFGCYQAATLCAKKYSPSHAVWFHLD